MGIIREEMSFVSDYDAGDVDERENSPAALRKEAMRLLDHADELEAREELNKPRGCVPNKEDYEPSVYELGHAALDVYVGFVRRSATSDPDPLICRQIAYELLTGKKVG